MWCLSRLGARRLFYGPINQVLPAATVSRWVETLAKAKNTGDAIAALAARTGDAARDLSEGTLALARKAIGEDERALAAIEGDGERDMAALGRIFGEELPPGLVVADE